MIRVARDIADQVFAKIEDAKFTRTNLGDLASTTVDGTKYRVVVDGKHLAYIDTAASPGRVDHVIDTNATLDQHVRIVGDGS